MYTPTLQLDAQGEKVEEDIALEMFKTFGCIEGDFKLTRSYVEQFKQGPTGTAYGTGAGRTSKHWHRSAVLMVNLGAGEKHWTVWSVQDEGQRMEVVLKSPVLSEDGWLSAHVLYLPPHFFHEVKSEPDSLAVHTFFMPELLHQHPGATIWATSSGAQEQGVLPAKYDEWKRENHISVQHVKEGGGGKQGGGGHKRARDGDGSAADMGAPSKKPAAAQVTPEAAEAEKPAAQVTAEAAEAMSLLPSLLPTYLG